VKRTKHEPLETYLKKIEAAVKYKDLIEPSEDPAKMFKRYARIVHPDVVPDDFKARATKAFAKLNELYSLATKGPAPVQVVIGGYVVTVPFAKGDIADIYEAEHSDGLPFLLKIVRKPIDNDLMDREAEALKLLRGSGPMGNFHKYLPNLQARTKASGRRVNVFVREEQHFTLKQIMVLTGGSIEDFRHIVWMGNRALSVLGFVHREGYIHGAVLPDHLLFNPADHGLKLIDWCYSCKSRNGDRIPALVKDYQDLYAPEVRLKRLPSPATDIFMLMKTLEFAANSVPKRFRDLIRWCMAGQPASRPHDAWGVQDRWITLAKEEFGPAKFVELKLITK
jgi:hypothetical protein